MIKQAIIPLAGLGTRLLPLTSVFAKELLPINGRPGIEYILDECIDAGIKEIVFIISTKKLMIKKYFYSDQFYKNIIKKKKDPRIINEYKKILKYKTGFHYFEPLWLYIRHNEAVNGNSPVFHRFLHFWGNHFAIQKKNAMYSYDVGPYHREVIAPAMLKNIEDLVYEVTISWAMIHNLDNTKSIGPNSPKAFKYAKRGKWLP